MKIKLVVRDSLSRLRHQEKLKRVVGLYLPSPEKTIAPEPKRRCTWRMAQGRFCFKSASRDDAGRAWAYDETGNRPHWHCVLLVNKDAPYGIGRTGSGVDNIYDRIAAA